MQNQNSKSKNDLMRRCYAFGLSVIKLFSGINFKNKTIDILSSQVIRSSTSIGANLIEAKSSSSKKEFQKYINISLRSANETKYWLCLLRDSNSIKQENIQPILQEADELSKIFASSVLKMKGKK